MYSKSSAQQTNGPDRHGGPKNGPQKRYAKLGPEMVQTQVSKVQTPSFSFISSSKKIFITLAAAKKNAKKKRRKPAIEYIGGKGGTL